MQIINTALLADVLFIEYADAFILGQTGAVISPPLSCWRASLRCCTDSKCVLLLLLFGQNIIVSV